MNDVSNIACSSNTIRVTQQEHFVSRVLFRTTNGQTPISQTALISIGFYKTFNYVHWKMDKKTMVTLVVSAVPILRMFLQFWEITAHISSFWICKSILEFLRTGLVLLCFTEQTWTVYCFVHISATGLKDVPVVLFPQRIYAFILLFSARVMETKCLGLTCFKCNLCVLDIRQNARFLPRCVGVVSSNSWKDGASSEEH